MEAVASGDHEITVTGSLLDERPGPRPTFFGQEQPRVVHDMRVSLRVHYPDLAITAVDTDMATRPYTICTDALAPLQRLVGLRVVQGFTRRVNELFGRDHGCTHLTALIVAMAPVVRQAAGAAFRGDGEASRQGVDRWFINTCQAWREDGPLHSLIKRGDEAGMRAMSAYPPPDAGKE
jgi:hypothetical protein